MSIITIPVLALAFTCLVFADRAEAQTQTFGASRTQNYGPTIAGGTTTMTARGSVTAPSLNDITAPTTLDVSTTNSARIRLFGVSTEAAAMTASLRADHVFSGFSAGGLQFANTTSSSFAVRLAGRTVLSDSRTNTTLSNNLAADAFVSDVPTYSVSLLGCGITVRGGATARARYTLTPQFSFGSGMSVSLSGPLRTSAVGTASAAVSVLGATAGVSSSLVYADTTASVNLQATPTGATGAIDFTVQQIRFVLDVFASFAGLSARERLVDWSDASRTGRLVLARQ